MINRYHCNSKYRYPHIITDEYSKGIANETDIYRESRNNRDKTKKIPESSREELRLLVSYVILKKYLISKVNNQDLDFQVQGVRTPNECVRINGKMHVHIM